MSGHVVIIVMHRKQHKLLNIFKLKTIKTKKMKIEKSYKSVAKILATQKFFSQFSFFFSPLLFIILNELITKMWHVETETTYYSHDRVYE